MSRFNRLHWFTSKEASEHDQNTRRWSKVSSSAIPSGGWRLTADLGAPFVVLGMQDCHSPSAQQALAQDATRPRRGGCRVCFVAEFGGTFYATAVWTNPSSPKLPQRTWLQLKRLAIASDAPKNTASRFMGWMRREIIRRYPQVVRLVSYQDCDSHTGAIYAAAGWIGEDIQERRMATWHNRKRTRFVKGKPKRVKRWTLDMRVKESP